MSNLTSINNPQFISYTHPTIFNLQSFNLTPTHTNPNLSITISPLYQSLFPQHSFNLSTPSLQLSTQPFSTITTEFHTPTYSSPSPLTIFNLNDTQLLPSQFNSIPLNQPINITITECLHNNQPQLFLTSIQFITPQS